MSFVKLPYTLSDDVSSTIGVISPTIHGPDDLTQIKEDLDTLGFACVGNILTEEEISTYEDEFWRALTRRERSLKRDDRTTWTPENTEWRGTYGAGQYKHYGMAQENHTWLVRKNQKIRNIFESIFAEQCCVSIDSAAALFYPFKSGLKLHVDLVPGIPGDDFGSIQGSVNMYEVKLDPRHPHKAGGGFVCVPGSHKLFDEHWEARKAKAGFKLPKKHWQVLEEDHPLQKETVLLATPANCLVLWDSRLLHRNYGGDYTSEELNRLCRLTQFVCWQPVRFRTEAALKKKVDNVLNGKCGNHWAALGFVEPIKPFPAWGNHKIPVVNPFKDVKKLPEDIANIL